MKTNKRLEKAFQPKNLWLKNLKVLEAHERNSRGIYI